jgi:hypothetical protein
MPNFRIMNKMWDQIANYGLEHHNCLHHCLSTIKPEPQQCGEDDSSCSFDGVGIFCHAFNELASDLPENDVEYYKQIVCIRKHRHCICDYAQDPNNCPVHDWNTSELSDDDKEDDEAELGSAAILIGLMDAKELNVSDAGELFNICWGDDDEVVKDGEEWGVEFTKDELKEIERIEWLFHCK